MRLARVRTVGGEILHGVVRGDSLRVFEGDLFGARRESASRVLPLKEVRLLAPVAPANLLCLGRNYRAHAAEGGGAPPKAPLLFIKATSCVIGPDDPIVIPSAAPEQVDFEAELAVVIGKPARRVSESDALDCVLGYTCANDVSARDCQAGDGQWARSKSFDTFGPLGPWIETELDPANLRIRGRLNGRTMQEANTSEADLQRPVRHQLPLSRDDAAARHGAADRHARRSRLRPQAAGLAEAGRFVRGGDRGDRHAAQSGGRGFMTGE